MDSDMGDSLGHRDMLDGDPILLTPEEAAKALRLGRTTVYALMKTGDLRPVHIGRSCRLSRAELERYVQRLETPVPTEPTRRVGRRRASVNQTGLFELASDSRAIRPVDSASCCRKVERQSARSEAEEQKMTPRTPANEEAHRGVVA